MPSPNKFKQITQKLTGFVSISSEQVDELCLILESEQMRTVSHEEARLLGESLVTVYQVLAGDREILGITGNEKIS